MEVYDENGSLLEQYDLNAGWLETTTRTIHHDAVEGVAEQSHEEVLREYPNGGKDVAIVIDVPGVEACDAWDEEVEILIYHPYTAEELAEQARQRAMNVSPGELMEAMTELAALLAENTLRLDEQDAALVELAALLAEGRDE